MREWESQSHVRWYCRYHVVIVPKYRRKSMYGALRRDIGPILKELCRRYGVELIEGHVMRDYVHMLLSIPPKMSVAHLIGKRKGKSTILINQKYVRQRNFRGMQFWSRGYCVSTTGYDEGIIRNYIKNQEVIDIKEEQLLLAI